MHGLKEKMDFKEAMVSSCELFPPEFFNKQMNMSIKPLHELFVIWRKAIHCFLNDLLDHHDALVGENACQIRAAALIDFSLDHNLKSLLLNISNQIHDVIDVITKLEVTPQDSNGTIFEFLEKNNLLFNIPKKFLMQVKFIIDSFILTLTKEKKPSSSLTLNERTSLEPIKKVGFVKNKAKLIVTNTQKSLSRLSCEYIISEASKHYDASLNRLLIIKYDAHKRSYLPQFTVGKIGSVAIFLQGLN